MGLAFFNAARKRAAEEALKAEKRKKLSDAAVDAEKRYAEAARTQAQVSSQKTKVAVKQGRTGKPKRGKK